MAPFPVLSLAANKCNGDVLAVCGTKVLILIIISNIIIIYVLLGCSSYVSQCSRLCYQ